jgi:hypothetical protein
VEFMKSAGPHAESITHGRSGIPQAKRCHQDDYCGNIAVQNIRPNYSLRRKSLNRHQRRINICRAISGSNLLLVAGHYC